MNWPDIEEVYESFVDAGTNRFDLFGAIHWCLTKYKSLSKPQVESLESELASAKAENERLRAELKEAQTCSCEGCDEKATVHVCENHECWQCK